MNFLIAMVSDNYIKSIRNMDARSYLVKLEMILERESIMTKAELANKELFPNYLLVRREFDPQAKSALAHH